MKRMLSAILTSMLLGSLFPAVAQQENQAQNQNQPQTGAPRQVMGEATTVQATIQNIDKQKGVVTLKDADGKTVKVHLGKGARNLNKLQKGDIVTATYYQSEAVMMAKPGEEPTGPAETMVMVRPENGEPGGMMVNTIRTSATIENINPKTREVTVKDAEGDTIKLKADKSVKNLNELKKGDEIALRYTEAAAISVTKPGQGQGQGQQQQ